MSTTHALSVGLPAPDRPSRSGPRGAWWAAFGLIGGLTVARLPQVADHLRRRVEEAIASGMLPDTTQRDLAVNIGMGTALALTLLVTLVVLAVARRVEHRVGLPDLRVGSRALPGMLVVVGAVLAAEQLAALAFASTDLRADLRVWAAVITALTVSTLTLARVATSRRQTARTIAVALAVGLLTVVV
jgi:hypothetical protein